MVRGQGRRGSKAELAELTGRVMAYLALSDSEIHADMCKYRYRIPPPPMGPGFMTEYLLPALNPVRDFLQQIRSPMVLPVVAVRMCLTRVRRLKQFIRRWMARRARCLETVLRKWNTELLERTNRFSHGHSERRCVIACQLDPEAQMQTVVAYYKKWRKNQHRSVATKVMGEEMNEVHVHALDLAYADILAKVQIERTAIKIKLMDGVKLKWRSGNLYEIRAFGGLYSSDIVTLFRCMWSMDPATYLSAWLRRHEMCEEQRRKLKTPPPRSPLKMPGSPLNRSMFNHFATAGEEEEEMGSTPVHSYDVWANIKEDNEPKPLRKQASKVRLTQMTMGRVALDRDFPLSPILREEKSYYNKTTVPAPVFTEVKTETTLPKRLLLSGPLCPPIVHRGTSVTRYWPKTSSHEQQSSFQEELHVKPCPVVRTTMDVLFTEFMNKRDVNKAQCETLLDSPEQLQTLMHEWEIRRAERIEELFNKSDARPLSRSFKVETDTGPLPSPHRQHSGLSHLEARKIRLLDPQRAEQLSDIVPIVSRKVPRFFIELKLRKYHTQAKKSV